MGREKAVEDILELTQTTAPLLLPSKIDFLLQNYQERENQNDDGVGRECGDNYLDNDGIDMGHSDDADRDN